VSEVECEVWLVMVEIEEISVQILYRELPSFQGFFSRDPRCRTNDCSSWFVRIDIFSEHPVNGRFERRLPLRKHIATSPVTRTQSLCLGKASNLKAECISVMLLCAFDISDRQLRHRLAHRVHFLLCATSSP